MTLKVREVRPQDVTPLVRFYKACHAESEWSWAPFSAAAARRSIREIMRRPDYVALIAAEDGEITGFLFGMVDAVFYGRTLYATDTEFYAHRGGKELVSEFRKWAKSKGAAIRLHATANKERDERRDQAKDRWFIAQGLERVGGMYQERLS